MGGTASAAMTIQSQKTTTNLHVFCLHRVQRIHIFRAIPKQKLYGADIPNPNGGKNPRTFIAARARTIIP
jgi:hypothetical protein